MTTENTATCAQIPDAQRGIFEKFTVIRNDGASAKGGKHHGCDYFVLDTTHDPYAEPALRAYAAACNATYPKLAEDLRAKAAAMRQAGVSPKLPKGLTDALKQAQELGLPSIFETSSGGIVFANDGGEPEDRTDLDCPICSGSGHRNDAEQHLFGWRTIPIDGPYVKRFFTLTEAALYAAREGLEGNELELVPLFEGAPHTFRVARDSEGASQLVRIHPAPQPSIGISEADYWKGCALAAEEALAKEREITSRLSGALNDINSPHPTPER